MPRFEQQEAIGRAGRTFFRRGRRRRRGPQTSEPLSRRQRGDRCQLGPRRRRRPRRKNTARAAIASCCSKRGISCKTCVWLRRASAYAPSRSAASSKATWRGAFACLPVMCDLSGVLVQTDFENASSHGPYCQRREDCDDSGGRAPAEPGVAEDLVFLCAPARQEPCHPTYSFAAQWRHLVLPEPPPIVFRQKKVRKSF